MLLLTAENNQIFSNAPEYSAKTGKKRHIEKWLCSALINLRQ